MRWRSSPSNPDGIAIVPFSAARPLHSPEGGSPRLLQVVADYEGLSAVQAAGRAGRGRASRLQYPGLRIWLARSGG
jgi:hypothetical protein